MRATEISFLAVGTDRESWIVRKMPNERVQKDGQVAVQSHACVHLREERRLRSEALRRRHVR